MHKRISVGITTTRKTKKTKTKTKELDGSQTMVRTTTTTKTKKTKTATRRVEQKMYRGPVKRQQLLPHGIQHFLQHQATRSSLV